VKKSTRHGIVVRWTLLTMVGLAAGIVTAVLLDRPIEAVVGMMLVTPILTLLAGAGLGASQWLQLRALLEHARLWVLATCIGLGAGLLLGVVTVEKIGGLLAGHRPQLIHLSVLERAISFAVIGLITGLSVGMAQWVIVLRRKFESRSWIATSAVSLGVAFTASSLIVDGVLGGIAGPVGATGFVVLAGLIFGAGTAPSLARCVIPLRV
jgi:hypothetical protein